MTMMLMIFSISAMLLRFESEATGSKIENQGQTSDFWSAVKIRGRVGEMSVIFRTRPKAQPLI